MDYLRKVKKKVNEKRILYLYMGFSSSSSLDIECFFVLEIPFLYLSIYYFNYFNY